MIEKINFEPVQTTPFKFKLKIKSYIWKAINKTLFRIPPSNIKWHRIFLLKLFGAKLAKNVNIHRLTTIDHPWNLTMGSYSSLGENTWAYCLAPITIGDKCCIGKDVYL